MTIIQVYKTFYSDTDKRLYANIVQIMSIYVISVLQISDYWFEWMNAVGINIIKSERNLKEIKYISHKK